MTLRPVGQLPASVYWRRRLLVLVPVAVFVLLVAYACAPDGRGETTAAPTTSAPTSAASTTAASTSATPTTTAPTTATPTTTAPTTAPPPTTAPTTAPPTTTVPTTAPPTAPVVPACAVSSVAVTALTTAPSYPLGAQPVLGLRATNIGTTACRQDVADPQVVLTVYQGTTRIWGSHDCVVQSGTNLATLEPGHSIVVSITWQGTTSVPGCAAARTAVPRGAYTLQAALAGAAGTAVGFSLT